MQDRVYQTPIQELVYLRRRLIDTCNDSSQSIVDDAVDESHKRLQPSDLCEWKSTKEDILNTCRNILG